MRDEIVIRSTYRELTFEGEAGTDLVGSLVQILGIKACTEAKGGSGAEPDVVGQSGDTAVVDFGLYNLLASPCVH